MLGEPVCECVGEVVCVWIGVTEDEIVSDALDELEPEGDELGEELPLSVGETVCELVPE